MDEAVFSSGQVSPKVWFCPQKTPVMIPRKKLSFKAIAVAAAIDMDGAVSGIEVVDEAIDSTAYLRFLHKVAAAQQGQPCIMLVDNLRVHYTKEVVALAAKLRIELCYNGIYSSEYNPIERLWAWSKARFTKRCTGDVPYHLQNKMRDLVESICLEDYSIGLRKRI